MNTQEQFEHALQEWTENSNREPMLELLKPFEDHSGLDIEESFQKGSDCGAIEIQGSWLAPYEDNDSGDATMLLLGWLQSLYEDIEFSIKKGEVTLACFKKVPECWDGPTVTSFDLPMAVLNAVVLSEWPPFDLSPTQGEKQ